MAPRQKHLDSFLDMPFDRLHFIETSPYALPKQDPEGCSLTISEVDNTAAGVSEGVSAPGVGVPPWAGGSGTVSAQVGAVTSSCTPEKALGKTLETRGSLKRGKQTCGRKRRRAPEPCSSPAVQTSSSPQGSNTRQKEGGSPQRGGESAVQQPPPCVVDTVISPSNPALTGLLTAHIQGLFAELEMEFERGAGTTMELTPPNLLRLQQQNQQMRSALTFLKSLTGGPEAGGSENGSQGRESLQQWVDKRCAPSESASGVGDGVGCAPGGDFELNCGDESGVTARGGDTGSGDPLSGEEGGSSARKKQKERAPVGQILEASSHPLLRLDEFPRMQATRWAALQPRGNGGQSPADNVPGRSQGQVDGGFPTAGPQTPACFTGSYHHRQVSKPFLERGMQAGLPGTRSFVMSPLDLPGGEVPGGEDWWDSLLIA